MADVTDSVEVFETGKGSVYLGCWQTHNHAQRSGTGAVICASSVISIGSDGLAAQDRSNLVIAERRTDDIHSGLRGHLDQLLDLIDRQAALHDPFEAALELAGRSRNIATCFEGVYPSAITTRDPTACRTSPISRMSRRPTTGTLRSRTSSLPRPPPISGTIRARRC